MKKFLLTILSATTLTAFAETSPVETDYTDEYNMAPTAAAPVTYVRCASRNYRYNSCYVPGGVRYVRLIRQHSNTRCYQNYNWGVRYNQIWVDRGCEATFEVTYGRYDRPRYPYPPRRPYPYPRHPRPRFPRRALDANTMEHVAPDVNSAEEIQIEEGEQL